MQVALLSTLEPSADDPATPRGLLRLGGRSIVQHQLAAALALGCERVVCLAEGFPGELIALQHAAERAGAGFQAVRDARGVARAIRADDDVLVIGDGLVASADAVGQVLGKRQGVVVQPVERGLVAGYERIDLNNAGGGVLRVPGRIVAALAELPGDWNPVSALLRLAVQDGLRQAPLPQAAVDSGRWALVRSDAEAHRLEPVWLRQHTARAITTSPGTWLAARLVETAGPALLHAGTKQEMVAIGAGVIAALGLGLAWFGLAASGFVLLGLAWLVRRCAALLAQIDRESMAEPVRWWHPETLFEWVLDGCFALVAVWRYAADMPGDADLAPAGFAALVLLGTLRLIPRVFATRRWAELFADRLLLALALAAASATGVFALALMAGGLVLLAFALAATYGRQSAQAAPAATAVEPGPERLTQP